MGGHADTVDLENFDDESDLTQYKVTSTAERGGGCWTLLSSFLG